MTIIDLGNGLFRLTATNGIEYIPTGAWYSEVITKEKNIPKYRAYGGGIDVRMAGLSDYEAAIDRLEGLSNEEN